ncbi:hypothetical protein SKAU_G00009090 [Synaphobranchus kaupii]|uniref:Uncharacterized protein n=1 Tax=Synaphobranchus kaupii TaxID=118154 RepID=A0A9Q1G9P3_SYNKA|nr:hypothetical protein SKAU_G00009090 [Synaphobranchus kaupii]
MSHPRVPLPALFTGFLSTQESYSLSTKMPKVTVVSLITIEHRAALFENQPRVARPERRARRYRDRTNPKDGHRDFTLGYAERKSNGSSQAAVHGAVGLQQGSLTISFN